jgi:hypothetical protein
MQKLPLPWSPRARVVASVLILIHLTAAFVAALVAAPPYSELSSAVAEVFRPYVNAADLNHGYRFFAPDPGPSHLVRYRLEFADGSKRVGQFPNLDEERPRLLYHRYFMLSEKLYGQFASWQDAVERSKETLPVEEQRRLAEAAPTENRLYQAFARSYANELLRRTGADRVTMELVEHLIPLPADVARGQRLDDPALYRTQDTLGPFGKGGVPEEVP